jgi:hypothetical protein
MAKIKIEKRVNDQGKPFRPKLDNGDRVGPWYVMVGDKHLHNDLTLREFAWAKTNGVETYSWYNTREAARRAVRAYRAANPEYHFKIRNYKKDFGVISPVTGQQFFIDALLKGQKRHDRFRYLHDDGVVRYQATRGEGGQIKSGWFTTLEDAQRAVKLYKLINS